MHATAVYEQVGFSISSAPFEEAGIPHVWMRRELDPTH
jgi:predicted GNAT family N-acyltransferase